MQLNSRQNAQVITDLFGDDKPINNATEHIMPGKFKVIQDHR